MKSMVSTVMGGGGLPYCYPSASRSVSFPFSYRLYNHNGSEWWNDRGGGGRGGGGQIQFQAQAAAVDVEEIIIREARLEDSWEVAETHCSSFFPHYTFPLDLALRMDRLLGLLSLSLSAFSLPNGCRRTCLVALLHNHQVAGILTLDTLADFLPRKGPLRQRRTGIAYVSNVAVRERDRCKGIAKRLMISAEAQAKKWGCRAIALHCDVNNPAATQLYKGQGFKCIKVPERAQWPQPKTTPNVHFSFMMKLLLS